MLVYEYLLWGLFGGFAVEGLELSGAIRRSGGWPWKEREEIIPLLTSIIIRLLVGGGLAMACGLAEQINGPFGALAIGVAAPLIIEQLTAQIPVASPGNSDNLAPTPPGLAHIGPSELTDHPARGNDAL